MDGAKEWLDLLASFAGERDRVVRLQGELAVIPDKFKHFAQLRSTAEERRIAIEAKSPPASTWRCCAPLPPPN